MTRLGSPNHSSGWFLLNISADKSLHKSRPGLTLLLYYHILIESPEMYRILLQFYIIVKRYRALQGGDHYYTPSFSVLSVNCTVPGSDLVTRSWSEVIVIVTENEGNLYIIIGKFRITERSISCTPCLGYTYAIIPTSPLHLLAIIFNIIFTLLVNEHKLALYIRSQSTISILYFFTNPLEEKKSPSFFSTLHTYLNGSLGFLFSTVALAL